MTADYEFCVPKLLATGKTFDPFRCLIRRFATEIYFIPTGFTACSDAPQAEGLNIEVERLAAIWA